MTNDNSFPVWPRPQQMRRMGSALRISKPLVLEVCGESPWLSAEADRAVGLVNKAAGRKLLRKKGGKGAGRFLCCDMNAMPGSAGIKAVRRPEGYSLSVSDDGILLAGRDAAGLFYGAQTLAQMARAADDAFLDGAVVRDWPRFPIRGAHVYMPAREHLEFFDRFLEFMARYKFNTLILEVGGGMQYDRRPEINDAWRRFCHDADNYEPDDDPRCERFKQRHPRGANALGGSRYFWKDSTHIELGGGDCLTKDEVCGIVDRCWELKIEVIPEVQSLSHAYYLCCAYPEIAERSDDPWPDTYCPSNPKTYEVLFDVMEEVIEVFRPRIMHIGHDELYHIGVCPRCRKQTGHELLARDLRKIHAFLTGRGVRPVLWGDKLMRFTDADGEERGGVGKTEVDPGTGKTFRMRPTWKAAERVPDDLLICDWYWSLDPESERHFREHGFEVVYGNFSPMGFKNWEKRAKVPYVLGAELSSWCEVSAYAFGHNGICHHYIPGADMLWRGRQMPREKVTKVMARRMPAESDVLSGGERWLVKGSPGKAVPVNLSRAMTPLSVVPLGSAVEIAGVIRADREVSSVLGTGRFRLEVDQRGVLSRAIVLGKSNPTSRPIPIGRRATLLLVLHGTNMEDLFFQPTYYSYHRDPAELLRYEVRYADGRIGEFASFFGEDIGPCVGPWPTGRGGICFRSVPVDFGSHTFYAQEWRNPRPKVEIESAVIHVGRDATEIGEVTIPAITCVC